MNTQQNRDLQDRLFRFAVDILRFILTLPQKKAYDVFRYPLSKSGTSMGANYEESHAAVSRKAFENKIAISLKEAKESNDWLRIIEELGIGAHEECKRLTQESLELSKIFAAILVTSKSTPSQVT